MGCNNNVYVRSTYQRDKHYGMQAYQQNVSIIQLYSEAFVMQEVL